MAETHAAPQGFHLFSSPLTVADPPNFSKPSSHTPSLRTPADIEEGEASEDALTKQETDNTSDTEQTTNSKPHFRHYHESRPIELFYDLFFVANLTSYTEVHTISDTMSLGSYIGFFCVLWLTWLQVSLFLVRFGADSIAERLFMGLQLGGMIGFSVLSPHFDSFEFNSNWTLFMAFSLILMATRLVLAVQYFTAYRTSRSLREGQLPMLLLACKSLVAAAVYGIVAGATAPDHSNHAYITWFVVAAFEAVANVTLSRLFKIISFKGTHLVERMSLLTLIIIGEGVIVLMKSIHYVVENAQAYSPTTVGDIFCVVVVYYFTYMLYFDKFTRTYFGMFRENLWAFLHFPFHISLVLFVQGCSAAIIFKKFLEQFNKFGTAFLAIVNSLRAQLEAGNKGADVVRHAAQQMRALAKEQASLYPKSVSNTEDTVAYGEALDYLLTFNGTVTSENGQEIQDSFGKIGGYLSGTIFNAYETGYTETRFTDIYIAQKVSVTAFRVTFGYLFVTAGIVLIMLSLLFYIRKTHKQAMPTRGWVSIGVHVLVGLAILLMVTCLVGTTSTTGSTGTTFLTSSWVLPMLALCYGAVLMIDLSIEVLRGHKWGLWKVQTD